MEHELIDWYDENGNYKGVIDKAIAHKKGLWHKSVHVWIVNDKNQILMQKRCAKKKFFPNYWDCSFAGHIGAGEKSLISAIREGEEELGLKLKPKDFKFLFTIKEDFAWKDIVSREFVDVFVLKKNVNLEDLRYQQEEVECAQYFEMAEIFKHDRSSNIFPHVDEYERLNQIFKNFENNLGEKNER